MLRLDLDRAPRWHDLPMGVRILVRPIGRTQIMAARSVPDVADLVGTAGDEAVGTALIVALAQMSILEWEGVADDAGAPLPVSPAAIDALLELPAMFEAWQVRVCAPAFAAEDAVAAEGNGCAPSPNGASAGATTTAAPAFRSARNVRAG